MDQLILYHKPNKNVRSESMIVLVHSFSNNRDLASAIE